MRIHFGSFVHLATAWLVAQPATGPGATAKPDAFDSPFREKPALVRIDFAPDNTIIIADEQPAFALRDGTPTHWRTAKTASTTAPAR